MGSVTGGGNYANTDLSNLTQEGKQQVAHLAIPGKVYTDLTLQASGSSYIAPADGIVQIDATTTGTQFVSIYTLIDDSASGTNSNRLKWDQRTGNPNYELTPSLMVQKGEKFYVDYNVPSVNTFRFIYAKGQEPGESDDSDNGGGVEPDNPGNDIDFD